MIFQDVDTVAGQHRDPRRGVHQEQVFTRRQGQRQRCRGAAQQRRPQPACLGAHPLIALGRRVELVDIQVKHRRQRDPTNASLDGHGAGGAFLHAVLHGLAAIVQQVEVQHVTQVDAHHGKAALARWTVVDGLYLRVEGQRGGVVHRRDAVSHRVFTEGDDQSGVVRGPFPGDVVGEGIGPAQHRGAGVGQGVGVAPVSVQGQGAVQPVDGGARRARRHVGGDAVGVGDAGDYRAVRGAVAAAYRIGIGDDVAVLHQGTGQGARGGLRDVHIKAGVRPGRQQVGVVAQDAILPARQAGQVQGHAAGAEGQQVSELRQAGIHLGGPGGAVPALNNDLQGVEQGEHNTGGAGVDLHIRAAAGRYGEGHLGGVIPQQRQHVADAAYQLDAIVAVLGGADGGVGGQIQPHHVVAGRQRQVWRNHRPGGGGVTRRIGGREGDPLPFGLLVEEGVAPVALGVGGGGHHAVIAQEQGDGAARFGGPAQHAAVGVKGPLRRARGDGIHHNRAQRRGRAGADRVARGGGKGVIAITQRHGWGIRPDPRAVGGHRG